jgi:hypothetical protein
MTREKREGEPKVGEIIRTSINNINRGIIDLHPQSRDVILDMVINYDPEEDKRLDLGYIQRLPNGTVQAIVPINRTMPNSNIDLSQLDDLGLSALRNKRRISENIILFEAQNYFDESAPVLIDIRE